MFTKRRAITALRKMLGMSQPKFAEAMGINLATLRAIEAGKFGVSDRVAEIVSLRTMVSQEWLKKGDPKKPVTPRGEPWTLEHYLLAVEADDAMRKMFDRIGDDYLSVICMNNAVRGVAKILIDAFRQDKTKEYIPKLCTAIDDILKELDPKAEWLDLDVKDEPETGKVDLQWELAEDHLKTFFKELNEEIAIRDAYKLSQTPPDLGREWPPKWSPDENED